MKNLQHFSQQIGIHFKPEYYVIDIEKEMACHLENNLWRKKSFLQKMQWMIALALKTISRLQCSDCFRGELYWQDLFAHALSTLHPATLSLHQMKAACHQANDLIEATHQIMATRTAIAEAVRENTLLSAAQERHYEAIRQMYQTHNDQLNHLNQIVMSLQREYNELRHQTKKQDVFFNQSIKLRLPRELFSYHTEKESLRVIEDGLSRRIRTSHNARTLYQELSEKLVTQKSTAKKMDDDMKAAQLFLKDKSDLILGKANALRAHINQWTTNAVEHRSQTLLAHAVKSEQLLSSCDKIILLLQQKTLPSYNNHISYFFTHLAGKNKALATIFSATCAVKATLDHQKLTPEHIAQLQQQIQTIEHHRVHYAQSITSQWSAFFFSAQKDKRQKELSINTHLQNTIAQMIIPLCGLSDIQTMALPAHIQSAQSLSTQLKSAETPIIQQQKEMELASPSFSR